MVRTQIYLTEQQQHSLQRVAEQTGKSQSQLIRDAVDRMIEQARNLSRNQILNDAAGLWQGRDDLPDFEKLRREADRLSHVKD